MIGSIITILLFLILFTLHVKKVFNTAQLVIIGWSLQLYYLWLGATLSALFFFVAYICALEIIYVIRNGVRIPKYILTLLILPLVYWIFFIFGYLENSNIFQASSTSTLVLNPIYFYIKNYLPLFLLGNRIKRESIDVGDLINFLIKLGKVVIIISVVRVAIIAILNIELINEILGHEQKDAIPFAGLNFIRFNAFFREPKYFSCFLGIITPLFFQKKMFKWFIASFGAGILTLSGTYVACLIMMTIVYFFARFVRNPRRLILSSVGGFVLTFMTLDVTKNLIIEYYTGLSSEDLSALVLSRIANRLDKDSGNMAGKPFLGIPLQADLEAPVMEYFKENPYLFLVGHGPGNSNLIPDKYYSETYAYRKRKKGERRGHIDMGYFNLLYEMGLFFLAVFVIGLSNVKTSKKNLAFYIFLLAVFLFFRVDYFLCVFYSALAGESVPRKGAIKNTESSNSLTSLS